MPCSNQIQPRPRQGYQDLHKMLHTDHVNQVLLTKVMFHSKIIADMLVAFILY